MKEYFIIRLQLDRLEFINYEDTKTLMQFSPPRCLLLLIAQWSVVSCWVELASRAYTVLQQIMRDHGQAGL